jgi:hypothetical protein
VPRKESIWVRSARAEDEFGDPIGPAMSWREIPGATVVPRESQDYEQRGSIIIRGFMVALGPTTSDTLVVDTDEVQIRGDVYQIEGAIGDYIKKRIFYTMRAN